MNDSTTLLDVESALKLTPAQNVENHARYGNAGLVTVMGTIGLYHKCIRAKGSYVWDSEGTRYLDLLCSYGAVGLGHNHPRVLEALKKVEEVPYLFQPSLGIMAGALAQNLALITPDGLERSFFCNSGTEAVEGALKLARAATAKVNFVSTENSYHGKTIGALSVTGRQRYREPFLPLLPGVEHVPYGDVKALERSLKKGNVAAFIVESIQGEGGVIVPPEGYLSEVWRLCSEFNTLLIIDEIQTGLGRTGRMFACEYEGISPDVMCLAKVLGGGAVPIGAFITTDEIWDKAFGGVAKSYRHSSTVGGNSRACAAGIAAIQVIVSEKLTEEAAKKGVYIIEKITALSDKYKMIKEVRGKGLLIGVEFHEINNDSLQLINSQVVYTVSRENLAALIASELMHKYKVVVGYSLSNPNTIRLAPPLNIISEDIDYFISSLEEVMARFNSFIE